MKRFYQEALKEDFGTNGYPAVVPESMATLADLLETPLTIEDVKQQFQLALTQLYGESRSVDALSWKEAHVTSEQWTDQINRMEERNKLKELADDYSL